MRDADFVSLHMPARPENIRFINRERLAQMGNRSWLVNTARGAVVDEAALFESLASGRIAGAALDVFAREPYVPAAGGGDLRSLSNVMLTPHVGSNTVESNRRMAERALMNIQFAQAGQFERMDVVNRDVLDLEQEPRPHQHRKRARLHGKARLELRDRRVAMLRIPRVKRASTSQRRCCSPTPAMYERSLPFTRSSMSSCLPASATSRITALRRNANAGPAIRYSDVFSCVRFDSRSSSGNSR